MRIIFKLAGMLVISLGLNTTHAAGCYKITSNSSVAFNVANASQYANCIEPSDIGTSPYLIINAHTNKKISFSVRLLDIAPNGSSVIASEQASADGVVSMMTQPGGRRLGITLLPSNSLSLNKDLMVAYVKDAESGVAVIDIAVSEPPNTVVAPTPTGPGSGGGTCDQYGFCQLPESQPGTSSLFRKNIAAAATSSACNATNTPPPQHPVGSGAPDTFDLNRAIGEAEFVSWAMDRWGLNKTLQKSLYLTNMFAPGREYDVKNNPTYYATSNFGNALYGAVGAALGFDEKNLANSAALVQQYQNYKKDGDPRQGDFSALLSGVYHAIKDGTGDGPGDREDIVKGINYYHQVYKQDPNKRNVIDSCQQQPNSGPSQGGGAELGPRSSWDATGVPINVPSSCVGNCLGNSITVDVGPIEVIRIYQR